MVQAQNLYLTDQTEVRNQGESLCQLHFFDEFPAAEAEKTQRGLENCREKHGVADVETDLSQDVFAAEAKRAGDGGAVEEADFEGLGLEGVAENLHYEAGLGMAEEGTLVDGGVRVLCKIVLGNSGQLWEIILISQ